MPGPNLPSEAELTDILEQDPTSYRPTAELARLLLQLANRRIPDPEIVRALAEVSRGEPDAAQLLRDLDAVRDCAEVALFCDPRTDDATRGTLALAWRRRHEPGLMREAERRATVTFSPVEARELADETLSRFFEPTALKEFLTEGAPLVDPIDVNDPEAIERWFKAGSPLARGLLERAGFGAAAREGPAILDPSTLNQLIRDPEPWPEEWLRPLKAAPETQAAAERVLALAGRRGDLRAERHRARRRLLIAVLGGALSSRLGFSPALGLPFVYRDEALRNDLKDALKTYRGRLESGTLFDEPEPREYPALQASHFSDPAGLIECLAHPSHPASAAWRKALDAIDPTLVSDAVQRCPSRELLASRLATAFDSLLDGIGAAPIVSPSAASDPELPAQLRRFLLVSREIARGLDRNHLRFFHRRLLELSFPALIHGPPPPALHADSLRHAAPGIDDIEAQNLPSPLHDAMNRAVLDLLLKTSIPPEWHGEATRLAVTHPFAKSDPVDRATARTLIYEIFRLEYREMARTYAELESKITELRREVTELKEEETRTAAIVRKLSPREIRHAVIHLEAILDDGKPDPSPPKPKTGTRSQWLQKLLDQVQGDSLGAIESIRKRWLEEGTPTFQVHLLDHALTRRRLDRKSAKLLVKETQKSDLARHLGIWVRNDSEIAELVQMNTASIWKRLNKPKFGLPPLHTFATEFVQARQRRVVFPNDNRDPRESSSPS